MIPHSGISRLVCNPDFATFDSDSRFVFISSPAFDASTLEVCAPLLNGGCCVVQEKPTSSLDDIANFILRHRITDVFLTSALVVQWLNISSIRFATCGNFSRVANASHHHMRDFFWTAGGRVRHRGWVSERQQLDRSKIVTISGTRWCKTGDLVRVLFSVSANAPCLFLEIRRRAATRSRPTRC